MKPRSATVVVLNLALAGCVCGGALAANLIRPAGAPSQARAALATGAAAHRGVAGTGTRPATGTRAASQGAAAGGTGPAAFTASVATLPGSGIVNEPSMAVDNRGEIFVTGPAKLGHSTSVSASPLWTSSDGGATWAGPISTETGAQTATGIGGYQSDMVIGPDDSVYVASSWLGGSAMAVSTDHGGTFTELPVSHATPVDDRPWLYYDPLTSALYMAWDGAEALHVGKALLGGQVEGQQVSAGPPGQLVFEQDVPALLNEQDRGCDICPPGTIVVDPSGTVHVAFAGPKGVGVASSPDGVTGWTQSFVPGTANANVSNDFQVLRGDGLGNLYLLWTQTAEGGDTVVYLSAKRSGSNDWQAPTRVSTSSDAVLGTLAVVSPGVVDVAYYGSGYAGDPNSAPDSTAWDLYLAKVQNVFGGASITTGDLLPNLHHGNLATQPLSATGSATDGRLGHFFSIAVDGGGLAGIVTAVDDGSGTKLQFVHEQPAPAPAPGPTFVLPAPAPATAAGPSFPYQAIHDGSAATASPTPDPAAAQDAATAATPSVDTRTASRPSGPKYPDGVAVSSPVAADGGGGGRGLPLWAYGLVAAGATAGRFILKRGRG